PAQPLAALRDALMSQPHCLVGLLAVSIRPQRCSVPLAASIPVRQRSALTRQSRATLHDCAARETARVRRDAAFLVCPRAVARLDRREALRAAVRFAPSAARRDLSRPAPARVGK